MPTPFESQLAVALERAAAFASTASNEAREALESSPQLTHDQRETLELVINYEATLRQSIQSPPRTFVPELAQGIQKQVNQLLSQLRNFRNSNWDESARIGLLNQVGIASHQRFQYFDARAATPPTGQAWADAELNRLRSQLHIARARSTVLGNELGKLESRIEEERQSFIAKLRSERNAELDRLKDEVGTLTDDLKERVKIVSSEIEGAREHVLGRLEAEAERARTLMNLVAGAALERGYGNEAAIAQGAARGWQIAAIICFLLVAGFLVAIGASTFFERTELELVDFLARVAGSISVLLLGGYCAARARDNREWARANNRFELSLLTLEPYLEGISDSSKKEEIRERLVERFFDPGYSKPEKATDPALVKSIMEPLTELIKALKKQ